MTHPHVSILDSKVAFFTVPVKKGYRPSLAFMVPTANCEGPAPRSPWTVFLQGMAFSSEGCQKALATILDPWRELHPQRIVLACMGDTLLASQNEGSHRT